jgi:hypothetical protein
MKDSKLHTIIIKILNRYTVSEYETFDDILLSDPNGVCLSIEEIEYVKKDPRVYSNFIKICELVDKKIQKKDSLSNKILIESILLDLDLSMKSDADESINVQYLRKNTEIVGTIEEILVSMDLSSKPYEALDNTI